MNTYFANCPKELESLLKLELLDLKIEILEVAQSGVLFKATEEQALLFLTSSRIAGRIFKHLLSFPCRSDKDIYDHSLSYSWNKLMNQNQTFKVQTLFDPNAKKHFVNSFHLSLKVKDGICDHFRQSSGARPNVETIQEKTDYPILLRIDEKDEHFKGAIFLDIAGKSLSHRGYRPKGHRAPLRENLAAGLILSSDWNPETDLFCDPFCGTGTLLVEAILIKGKIHPSYLNIRDYQKGKTPYAFLRQKWFEKNRKLRDYWEKLTRKIVDQSYKSLKELPSDQFYGNDRDLKSFQLAVKSLSSAKINREVVGLKTGDACQWPAPSEAPGVVISNLPFGERIALETIEKLYYKFGENLKQNWKGWRSYLLMSNPDLRKKIELRSTSRMTIYNGKLECRLVKYELY